LAKIENGNFYTVVNDHLGTPQELVDEVGKIVWSVRQKSWGGIEQARVNDVVCQIRFQGQWLDDESGLCYNRFRYYDSETSQYISTDPIGLLGGTNVYGYVVNPLLYIDPLGLSGTGGAYMFGFTNGAMYIGKGEEPRMNNSINQRTSQTNSTIIGQAHVSTGGNNELGKMVEYKAMINAGFTRNQIPSNYLNTYLSGEKAWKGNPNLQDRASVLAKELKNKFDADVQARKGTCNK